MSNKKTKNRNYQIFISIEIGYMYLTKKAKSLQNPQLCMNFGSRNTFSFKCRGLNIIYRFKFLKKNSNCSLNKCIKHCHLKGTLNCHFKGPNHCEFKEDVQKNLFLKITATEMPVVVKKKLRACK